MVTGGPPKPGRASSILATPAELRSKGATTTRRRWICTATLPARQCVSSTTEGDTCHSGVTAGEPATFPLVPRVGMAILYINGLLLAQGEPEDVQIVGNTVCVLACPLAEPDIKMWLSSWMSSDIHELRLIHEGRTRTGVGLAIRYDVTDDCLSLKWRGAIQIE